VVSNPVRVEIVALKWMIDGRMMHAKLGIEMDVKAFLKIGDEVQPSGPW
jgi:hypothetical protein